MPLTATERKSAKYNSLTTFVRVMPTALRAASTSKAWTDAFARSVSVLTNTTHKAYASQPSPNGSNP